MALDRGRGGMRRRAGPLAALALVSASLLWLSAGAGGRSERPRLGHIDRKAPPVTLSSRRAL